MPSRNLARRLIALYPRKWRERYGEELIELAGSPITWSVAVNIAESGIRERLNMDGYSPVRFAALFIRLIVAFMAFILLTIGEKFVDFYFRFPGRPLPVGMAAAFVRSTGVAALSELWLMFALFATLLAVVGNATGWRERRPRLVMWSVRLGVFSGLLLIFFLQELPRLSHSSPYNYLGELYVLIAALVVGSVVESAKLGRQLGLIAR